MSDETKIKLMEVLAKNGIKTKQLILENTGTNIFNESAEQKTEEKKSVSDEDIAAAITAINGKDKPLDSKRKWAAVHWYLRWAFNFPVKAPNFCQRIAMLPLGELEYECDYNSFRHYSTFSFMNQDATHLDKIKPRKDEESFFIQCRAIALALSEKLPKQDNLPQKK